MKFWKNVPYMYISKVNKFLVNAYLYHDNVEESIEGDATLHHPPQNRVNFRL